MAAAAAERVRILLVDDDALDRQALTRALARSTIDATCDEAADAETATALATTNVYDCFLLDHDLPTKSGLELARELRAAGVRTPIVLVTGRDEDDQLESAAADAGVTDYLPKAEVSTQRLARRIRFAIRIGRAEADAAAALAAATHAAHARDDVLAVVSHDLRGPLHAISLACEALRDDLPAESVRYLGAIERAAARAERLISDLLEASAIENGALTLAQYPTDAASLVRQAAADSELQASESGARITTSVPDEPFFVSADRDRVMQVLSNLLGNALKHARGAPIEITLEKRAEDARITVRDHGLGIPETALPHIFDRYWRGRSRKAGAGLGLAIAKGIVDAHGGTITAATPADGGVALSFTLPLATSHT
ncbi:MAG TPA: ATP-binding protein [Gemmatimonadaceae bacterium]|jgi:signal transduction histidine kinase|nr:ATP-binding protein [Gemmatimonadaceae bacterium]